MLAVARPSTNQAAEAPPATVQTTLNERATSNRTHPAP
jgi:hypothetical protein